MPVEWDESLRRCVTGIKVVCLISRTPNDLTTAVYGILRKLKVLEICQTQLGRYPGGKLPPKWQSGKEGQTCMWMSFGWLDRMTDGSPFSLPFDKIFDETSGLSWVFLQQRTLLNTHLLDTHRNSRHHCHRRVVGRGTCHNRTLMYHPHYLAP